MKTSLALALVVVMAMAGSASAALQVVVEGPVDLDSGALLQFKIYAAIQPGDSMDEWASSIDGRFDGPMHQIWAGGFYPTPMMDSATYLDANQQARDTHMLFFSSIVGAVRLPVEDNVAGVGSYVSGGFDQGGAPLNFAIGILGDYQVANFAIAQIVLPVTAKGVEPVTVTLKIAKRGGQDSIETVFDIPEPMTLGLLAVGAVGLVIRRRRR